MKTLTLKEEPKSVATTGGAADNTEEDLTNAEEEFEKLLRESGE